MTRIELARLVLAADVVVWALLFYLLLSIIWAARGGIGRLILLFAWGIAGVVVLNVILVKIHRPELARYSLLAGGLGFLFVKPRSRYIRASDRRKAIARYERSGRKYDPQKHDIDHRWAFAKGGSNRADNLRVLDRSTNRRKRKKDPRLRDWF